MGRCYNCWRLPRAWKYRRSIRCDSRADHDHSLAPDRRTLSPVSVRSSPASSALALFASGTPSPLYGTYRELWGFSPVVLTLIYATYAFGVLATLILAGRDLRPGRAAARPARRARDAHGHDRRLHGRRLRGLALRRPRHPGPRDRPRAGRRQRRAARPPSPPRPGGRRPDERRRERRRDGPRRPRLGDVRRARSRRRASSPTSRCSSSSRSRSSASRGCPSPSAAARARG